MRKTFCAGGNYTEAMTTRPVYTPKLTRPFYQQEDVEFDWNSGTSPAQKQKNSALLQETWKKKHPGKTILEVSTKSTEEMGRRLSPFNMTLRLPSLRKAFPVENVYQASKAFRHGGPYVDLLGVTPVEAKRDPRLRDSGELVFFELEKKKYPTEPVFLFYNWLYLITLLENPKEAAAIRDCDAYCDIEFNPDRQINCQARACAIYHSLFQLNLLDEAKDFEGFKKIMMANDITEIKEQSGRKEDAQTLNDLRSNQRRTSFAVGTWIRHPTIGAGEVIRRTPDSYVIRFRVSGPKALTRDFVELNCKKIG